MTRLIALAETAKYQNCPVEPRFPILVKAGNDTEGTMDRVTRCLHCGKRMVPTPSYTGRTELKCVFCDRLDPMETAEPVRWVDNPLTAPVSDRTVS